MHGQQPPLISGADAEGAGVREPQEFQEPPVEARARGQAMGIRAEPRDQPAGEQEKVSSTDAMGPELATPREGSL